MFWTNFTHPKKTDDLILAHEQEILASEHTSKSAAPFRSLVKQSRGLEGCCVDDVNKRVGVRTSLVIRRLRPTAELEPSDLWKVLWDSYRCFYLSWKLGLAHGDNSLSNMMSDERDDQKFCVLNDYDLAEVMDSGDRCSSQSRWEQAGTIPFMAVDLLYNPNAELKRLYRHDLEASAWCLAYHMLEEHPKDWLGYNMTTVAGAKCLFLIKAAVKVYKEEWRLYTGFLLFWMRKWYDVQAIKPPSLAGMPEGVLSAGQQQDTGDDHTYIRTAILEARKLRGVKLVESLDDTSWINLQLTATAQVQ